MIAAAERHSVPCIDPVITSKPLLSADVILSLDYIRPRRRRARLLDTLRATEVMASLMAKKPSLSSSTTDTDGNAIGNKILLSLSRTKCNEVFSAMELVRLKRDQVIHEAGETIKSGYFLNTGVAVVLVVQQNGQSVGVALIGNEGFIGLPLVVGYRSSPTRVLAQSDATAYRCDIAALRRLVRECPGAEQQLHRFGFRLAMQAMQIAACNQLHDVEERLARWILMSQDRMPLDELPLMVSRA